MRPPLSLRSLIGSLLCSHVHTDTAPTQVYDDFKRHVSGCRSVCCVYWRSANDSHLFLLRVSDPLFASASAHTHAHTHSCKHTRIHTHTCKQTFTRTTHAYTQMGPSDHTRMHTQMGPSLCNTPFKTQVTDAAKKRAVAQNVDYETFKNMVSVAHLKPLQAPNTISHGACVSRGCVHTLAERSAVPLSLNIGKERSRLI